MDEQEGNIIRDIFLIEFLEKFTQHSELVNIQQLREWYIYLSDKPIGDVCVYKSSKKQLSISPNFNKEFETHLQKKYPISFQILDIGKGKISICGPSIIWAMYPNFGIYPEFYFHSCSIQEARKLLYECLEILGDDFVYYIVDNELHYRCRKSSALGFGKFCLTIYENKGNMLRNIGQSPGRNGWNPIDGYFATISCALTIAMNKFPFDIDSSYVNLNVYSDLGYDIIFHGLDKTLESGDVIPIDNGYIECGGEYGTMVTYNNQEETQRIYIRFQNLVISSLNIQLHINNNIKYATSPSTWYKEFYKSCIVGITNERYIAFRSVKDQYDISADIFRLLCNYWLIAEGQEASQRISIQND